MRHSAEREYKRASARRIALTVRRQRAELAEDEAAEAENQAYYAWQALSA
jgi:hypothetical protein